MNIYVAVLLEKARKIAWLQLEHADLIWIKPGGWRMNDLLVHCVNISHKYAQLQVCGELVEIWIPKVSNHDDNLLLSVSDGQTAATSRLDKHE